MMNQFALPFANRYCGQCITQYIGHGTAHIAKYIDRQYQRHAVFGNTKHFARGEYHYQ